jgi:hypothetical protein
MKEKIRGGYYLKARCIKNSEIANMPPYVREIWDWLLKEANHKENKTHGIIVKRGQLIRTFKDIQQGLKWKIGWKMMSYKMWQIDKAMRALRKATMIATIKATRGLLISICNYDLYQNPANYDSDRIATTRGDRRGDTINNNDNNDKNEKNNKNKKVTTRVVIPPSANKVNRSKVKINFNFNFSSKTWENIAEEDKERWKAAFPACDIELELRRMGEWLIQNPDKKKTRYGRFIFNWLSRNQDRGGELRLKPWRENVPEYVKKYREEKQKREKTDTDK